MKQTSGHDDSYCFNASIYLGQIKLADVSDDGWGGPEQVHINPTALPVLKTFGYDPENRVWNFIEVKCRCKNVSVPEDSKGCLCNGSGIRIWDLGTAGSLLFEDWLQKEEKKNFLKKLKRQGYTIIILKEKRNGYEASGWKAANPSIEALKAAYAKRGETIDGEIILL